MSNKNGIFVLHRGMEQLVARRAHNPKVGGSNPSPATRSNPVIYRVFLFPPVTYMVTNNFKNSKNSLLIKKYLTKVIFYINFVVD